MQRSLGWLRILGALIVGLLLIETITPQPVRAASWGGRASLPEGRGGHTATLLPDGRVLVVGGETAANDPNTALNKATVYNAQTNTWTEVATMSAARAGHTATLLSNGRVLVVGGAGAARGGGAAPSPAEIFNPANDTWSASPGATERVHHTATLLPDGRVLIVGGEDLQSGGATSRADSEIYDPGTNSWSPAGSMASSRAGHAAIILPTGQVMVMGGAKVASGTATPLATTELYDPATNRWSSGPSLAVPRTEFTATSLQSGKVLAVGGDASCLATAELFDLATNRWAPTGPMAASRARQTATLLASGRVLVVGGDLRRAGTSVGPTTVGALSVDNALALPTLQTTELYDPATDSWSPYDPLPQPRSGHTATLLPDGQLLVVGGFGDNGAAISSVVGSQTQAQAPAPTSAPQQSVAPSAAPSAPPPPPPPAPSPADFTLSALPPSRTVAPGESTTYAITIVRANLPAAINLSIAGLPQAVVATFDANPTTANAVLTLTTTAGAGPGTYFLPITGTGAGLTRVTTVTLVITAPPTPTRTPARSASPQASPSPSPTATFTPTPTATATPTPTDEPSQPDPTKTPTRTPTRTPARTPTRTSTATSTATSTPTSTPTNTQKPPRSPANPPDGTPGIASAGQPLLVAHVAANPLPASDDGGADVSKVVAANALDCPAQTAGLPTAGGGWWANQRAPVSPTLLVLALLALGTGALAAWGWRRRIRELDRERSADA